LTPASKPGVCRAERQDSWPDGGAGGYLLVLQLLRHRVRVFLGRERGMRAAERCRGVGLRVHCTTHAHSRTPGPCAAPARARLRRRVAKHLGHRGQFAGPETLAEADLPHISSPLLLLAVTSRQIVPHLIAASCLGCVLMPSRLSASLPFPQRESR
jgi:hypothetical protein